MEQQTAFKQQQKLQRMTVMLLLKWADTSPSEPWQPERWTAERGLRSFIWIIQLHFIHPDVAFSSNTTWVIIPVGPHTLKTSHCPQNMKHAVSMQTIPSYIWKLKFVAVIPLLFCAWKEDKWVRSARTAAASWCPRCVTRGADEVQQATLCLCLTSFNGRSHFHQCKSRVIEFSCPTSNEALHPSTANPNPVMSFSSMINAPKEKKPTCSPWTNTSCHQPDWMNTPNYAGLLVFQIKNKQTKK